jgi:hypothetical protein
MSQPRRMNLIQIDNPSNKTNFEETNILQLRLIDKASNMKAYAITYECENSVRLDS